MKVAVEHHFTGTTEPITGTYDSDKTMIGSLLKQSTGSNPEDKYISPRAAAISNIPEVSGGAGTMYLPHVVQWSSNIYWVFVVSNATAAVTRTIGMYEFDSNTSTLTWKGYITLSGTTVAGNKTARSLRAMLYEHTTGTVSTSGSSTTITGSGTGFQSERIAVGARIGFGTTDPTAVTTWYEITAIASDTSLTISAPVTLSAGTSYVIEELRIAVLCTNATPINGGVHLIKGLNYSTFVNGGTTITEATTVDNIRASYLLKPANVASASNATFTVTIAAPGVFTINNHGLLAGDIVFLTTTGALPTGLAANTAYYVISTGLTTNTFQLSATYNGAAITTTGTQSGTHTMHTGLNYNGAGIGLDDFVSNTDHSIYVVNAESATARVTKFNIRAALTVGSVTGGPSGGVSSSAHVARTVQQAVTGTVAQLANARVYTVNHGSASGVKSLWFATTTRIYRCPIANITEASTNWLADAMVEVPPGGGNITYTTTSTMSQVDYASSIDRMFITTTSGRFGTYVAQYDSSGSTQFDRIIGTNLNRYKLTSTAVGSMDGLFPQATLTLWSENGWLFSIPNTTTSGLNWLYVFPFGCDSTYHLTSNQYMISPKLATTNATKLYQVYFDHMEYSGSHALGYPVESYRSYYRTSGIDDNSGAWVEIPIGGDLTGVAASDYIQFKVAFDIMGEICVPTRLYSLCCVYEDSSQDSHYQPSLTKSSAANRQFVWRQVSSWGSSIPDLQIRLYNTSTGFLVLDDTVNTAASGDWEYSTDGTTWNAWNAAQDAVGNYIRYTADSLPNNITVRALLTQV